MFCWTRDVQSSLSYIIHSRRRRSREQPDYCPSASPLHRLVLCSCDRVVSTPTRSLRLVPSRWLLSSSRLRYRPRRIPPFRPESFTMKSFFEPREQKFVFCQSHSHTTETKERKYLLFVDGDFNETREKIQSERECRQTKKQKAKSKRKEGRIPSEKKKSSDVSLRPKRVKKTFF